MVGHISEKRLVWHKKSYYKNDCAKPQNNIIVWNTVDIVHDPLQTKIQYVQVDCISRYTIKYNKKNMGEEAQK